MIPAQSQPAVYPALFELGQPFRYPDTAAGCPFCDNARRVWFQFDSQTYGGSENSPADVLYYPLALRDAGGNYFRLPLGTAGERYWCLWSAESGCWEVLAPGPPASYQGVLTAGLSGSDGEVDVLLYNGGVATAWTISAACWWLGDGKTLPAGTKVQIEWFAEAAQWYITQAAGAA